LESCYLSGLWGRGFCFGCSWIRAEGVTVNELATLAVFLGYGLLGGLLMAAVAFLFDVVNR